VNSASWTNQGPQQWDQPGSVDGQFPHSTMPQDPYNQMDRQGQFQHGTVIYASLIYQCNIGHKDNNIIVKLHVHVDILSVLEGLFAL